VALEWPRILVHNAVGSHPCSAANTGAHSPDEDTRCPTDVLRPRQEWVVDVTVRGGSQPAEVGYVRAVEQICSAPIRAEPPSQDGLGCASNAVAGRSLSHFAFGVADASLFWQAAGIADGRGALCVVEPRVPPLLPACWLEQSPQLSFLGR
jgi:hypothetical protein